MAKYLDYAGLQELVSKLKAYVEGAISEIDLDLFVVVDTLPETGEANKIYLVPGEVTETGNIYVEYGWVNGAWEKLGEVKLDTDLSNYYTKDEVDQKITDVETEIAKKQDTLTAGTNISIEDNTVSCTLANVSELDNDSGYLTESDMEAISNDEIDALFD